MTDNIFSTEESTAPETSGICPQCGRENPVGTTYCKYCGNKLTLEFEPEKFVQDLLGKLSDEENAEIAKIAKTPVSHKQLLERSQTHAKGFIIEDGVLRGYTGTETTLILPKTVVKLEPEVFKESKVSFVQIPSTIQVIHKQTFASAKLTAIALPSDLKLVDASAFQENSELTEIKLPSGVLVVGAKAFSWCMKLKEVVLPKKLKIIDARAFFRCDLSNIALPKSVEYIGPQAFAETKLTEVRVPVECKLDKDAFPPTCQVIRY